MHYSQLLLGLSAAVTTLVEASPILPQPAKRVTIPQHLRKKGEHKRQAEASPLPPTPDDTCGTGNFILAADLGNESFGYVSITQYNNVSFFGALVDTTVEATPFSFTPFSTLNATPGCALTSTSNSTTLLANIEQNVTHGSLFFDKAAEITAAGSVIPNCQLNNRELSCTAQQGNVTVDSFLLCVATDNRVFLEFSYEGFTAPNCFKAPITALTLAVA